MFPWGDSGKYKLEELPDLPEIEIVLAEVGALARLYKQRLTAHPSEFVKMAAQKDDIIYKSILDLENHSRVSLDCWTSFSVLGCILVRCDTKCDSSVAGASCLLNKLLVLSCVLVHFDTD